MTDKEQAMMIPKEIRDRHANRESECMVRLRQGGGDLTKASTELLKECLADAVRIEWYDFAAQVRDELKAREAK